MLVRKDLMVFALISAPGMALAQGCHADQARITASSCAEGTIWDQTLKTCLPMTNS